MTAVTVRRVLCVLGVAFLVGMLGVACEGTSTATTQLVVSNLTGVDMHVTANGVTQFVANGDAVSFDVPNSTTYTVTTSTGKSQTVTVGVGRTSITFT